MASIGAIFLIQYVDDIVSTARGAWLMAVAIESAENMKQCGKVANNIFGCTKSIPESDITVEVQECNVRAGISPSLPAAMLGITLG